MKISRDGDSYVLQNNGGDSISLSDAEVLALSQSARQIADLLQRSGPSGEQFQPISTLPVEDITMSLDAIHSKVLVCFLLQGGDEQVFELSQKNATSFRDMLTRKVQQIESSRSTRKVQ